MTADTTIIGLGYVGLTLAVVMAEAGLTVIGVERDAERRRALAAGQVDIHEPGLRDALMRNLGNGRIVIEANPSRCQSHIVCVGTQTADKNGLRHLTDAINALRALLAEGDLVVLRSTLPVGGTRKTVAPLLRGTNALIAHCPERTAEGVAVAELARLPQIVGGLSQDATNAASALFAQMGVTVLPVSSPEAAEIAKLSTNALRDLIFAFSNETAMLAEAAGADMFEIVDVTNAGYPRAGLARPGPVGGPCLSKDPALLSDSAMTFGVQAQLATLARSVNAGLPGQIAKAIQSTWGEGAPPQRVLIAGLAFKGRPETSDTRGSPAGPLLDALKVQWPDADYVGADPLVTESTARSVFDLVTYWPVERAAKNADLVILATNHPSFSDIDLAAVADAMTPDGLIYDLWAQVTTEVAALPHKVRYRAFGSA